VSTQDWREMGRADFDAAAPLTLFDLDELGGAMTPRGADECGTPDLWSAE
jgi:hypothetical protein